MSTPTKTTKAVAVPRHVIEALQAAYGQHAPTGIEASVCAEIAQRQRDGIQKYGQDLAANDLPLSDRLQHAKEEVMDATSYLEWARLEAKKLEDRIATLECDLENAWLRRDESYKEKQAILDRVEEIRQQRDQALSDFKLVRLFFFLTVISVGVGMYFAFNPIGK